MVDEFRQSRENLIQVVMGLPKEKREQVLFDKWTLKNVLSHLSGWAKYQTDTLRQFRKEGRMAFQGRLKASINDDYVSQREKWGWSKVYQEFLKLTGNLIREYEALPRELWKKKIYQGKETAVEDFIKIEINHYNNTHGPQIKKAFLLFPHRYATAVIINDHRVLLLKRSEKEDDEAGKWCPVNESIEENEPPEKAVIRGVKEEIGTGFSIIKQLQDHHYDGRTAVFLGQIVGKIKPEQDEVDEYGWFSYKEAMRLESAYGYDQLIQNLVGLKLIK